MLQEIRIQEAFGLLLKYRSVKRTAYELGYYNAAHLCRHFRAVNGYSPGDYLKKNPTPETNFRKTED